MVLAVGVSLHYIVGSHIIVYETKISAVAQPVRDGVTQKVGSRLQLESRIFSLQGFKPSRAAYFSLARALTTDIS